jgi:hypothetical protein
MNENPTVELPEEVLDTIDRAANDETFGEEHDRPVANENKMEELLRADASAVVDDDLADEQSYDDDEDEESDEDETCEECDELIDDCTCDDESDEEESDENYVEGL